MYTHHPTDVFPWEKTGENLEGDPVFPISVVVKILRMVYNAIDHAKISHLGDSTYYGY